jgi:hypothetical protein
MALVQAPFSTSPTGPTWTPGQNWTYTGGSQGTMLTGATSGLAEGMLALGPIVSIFGAVNSAIGSYYSAQNQKNQLQMQAQNQRFAAEMARVNQRGAQFTASQIGLAGQKQIGRYTLGAGQQRAGARASLAARGAVLGQGTAAEVVGSMDVIKEVDMLSMSAATVRAQEAAKLQAFNLGTQALMADLSAQNLQASGQTIYPGLALGTSLLGSAADIGSTWARNRRLEELLAGVSTQRM